MKPNILPPFQVDYTALAEISTNAATRQLSQQTINMCILALNEMHYNRYWLASGERLTVEQQHLKNDIVDAAILELLLPVDDTSPALPGDAIEQITQQILGAGGCQPEKCEDDNMPYILRLNGVAYLADNCSCGDTQLYQLNQASVDANGAVYYPQLGDVAFSFPGVTETAEDCYALASAEFLLGRVIDWHSSAVDLALQGLDILTELPEIANWFLVLGDILNGAADMPQIVAIAKSQVASVLSDTDLIESVAADWIYPAGITREGLKQYAKTTDKLVAGVPLQLMFWGFALTADMTYINQQLAILAAECESGLSAGGNPIDLGGGASYTELPYSGETYPIWVQEYDPILLIVGGTTSIDVPSTDSIMSVIWETKAVPSAPPGNAADWIETVATIDTVGTSGSHRIYRDDAMHYIGLSDDATYAAIANSIHALDVSNVNTAINVGTIAIKITSALSAYQELHSVTIIGEPL